MEKNIVNDTNFRIIYIFCFVFSIQNLVAQSEFTEADKSALEAVIVEEYYKHDAMQKMNDTVLKNATTYRIYIDLKPTYILQAVYGSPSHELYIATTTSFYNHTTMGVQTGDMINDKLINEPNVAFDSWLSMGGASKLNHGIMRLEDSDGSIINTNSFEKNDGLCVGNVSKVILYGLDLAFFDDVNNGKFYTSNGSWASLIGAKGPTKSNRILIAQLTTNGKLSFELNIQLRSETGTKIQFVAKNPSAKEFLFKNLTYTKN